MEYLSKGLIYGPLANNEVLDNNRIIDHTYNTNEMAPIGQKTLLARKHGKLVYVSVC